MIQLTNEQSETLRNSCLILREKDFRYTPYVISNLRDTMLDVQNASHVVVVLDDGAEFTLKTRYDEDIDEHKQIIDSLPRINRFKFEYTS